MLKPLIALIPMSLLLVSCDLFRSFFEGALQKETKEEELCVLSQKNYPVHSATFYQEEGKYELILLEAPTCFKNPLVLENLRLGKQKEGEAEKATLDYVNESHSTLYIKDDFSLTLKGQETDPKTGLSSSVSSLWTPFLVGAAGAAVGSMIANRFSAGPQYVTPPAPSSSSSILRGLDEKNVSDKPISLSKTKDLSYNNNHSTQKPTSQNSFGSSQEKIKKFKTKSYSSKSRRSKRR